MNIFLLVASACQILFVLFYLYYVYHHEIGFVVVFLGLFTFLNCIPFLLITFQVQGVFDFWNFIATNYQNKYVLDFGDGIWPEMVILALQALFWVGVIFASSVSHWGLRYFPQIKFNSLKDLSLNEDNFRRFLVITLVLGGIVLGYKITRFIITQDFPLYVYFLEACGRTFAQISLDNSANRDVPYLFLPSVDRQFYRILAPLSAVMMFALYRYSGRRVFLGLLVIMVFLAAFFNIGVLKRTPLLYLGLWLVLFFVIYQHGSIMARTIYSMVIIFPALLLLSYGQHSLFCTPETGLIEKQTSVEIEVHLKPERKSFHGIRKLFGRVLAGEAVGSYLAFEHLGSTIDHTGLYFVKNYLKRVIGVNVQTHGEFWLATVSGKDSLRGSSALSIFAEAYLFFGFWPMAFTGLGVGFLLRYADLLLAGIGEFNVLRPIAAGLIVTIGTMSVKGFLPQFFTGGTLVLLTTGFCLFVLFRFKGIWPSVSWLDQSDGNTKVST